jgi:hypothetical protein
MRFLMLMAAMTRYNLELRDVGMLLALDGLRPPVDGASIVFEGSEARVVDGPFADQAATDRGAGGPP